MQIHRLILFVAIVAVLIALLLWHGKRKTAEMPVALSPAASAAASAARTLNAPSRAPVHSNAPAVSRVVPSPLASIPPVESKEQQMGEGLAMFNDVDIKFYGRLEDQFGNAKIKLKLVHTK